MALTVEKLNDDTTFIFAFAPIFAPKKAGPKFPGAFTILMDPWLTGNATIGHPGFQTARHTGKCALESLASLKEPVDLIVISQDFPDHCHQETLCTLPADTGTKILATPSAAKKIWSWKHFDPSVVHVLKPYNSEKKDTVTRVSLPSYTSTSAKGEITIANIPAKRDVTGLHNAIGITYRPPASMLTAMNDQTVNLSDLIAPPISPKLRQTRSAINLTESSGLRFLKRPRTASSPRQDSLNPLSKTQTLPDRPATNACSRERSDSVVEKSKPRAHIEKTLSIVYTPHGVNYATLSSYLEHHLYPANDTTRLTALFHCINTEENPWLLGGKVANGAPGGVAIAQDLRAKYWFSAHDEKKELKGVSTTWLRSTKYSIDEVRKMLATGEVETETETEVHTLGVGETIRVEG